MSLTPEDRQPELDVTAPAKTSEAFDPRNKREIVHIGRNMLLRSVRSQLAGLEPQLASNGGIGFYKGFPAGALSCSVLVTTHPDLAAPGTTIVSVNTTRSPEPDEPGFPDGRVMELMDMCIPRRTRWLNTGWDILYKGQNQHGWDRSEFATILCPIGDSVKLVGNLSNEQLQPIAAGTLDEVDTDADKLWTIYAALQLCEQPASLQPEITGIIK